MILDANETLPRQLSVDISQCRLGCWTRERPTDSSCRNYMRWGWRRFPFRVCSFTASCIDPSMCLVAISSRLPVKGSNAWSEPPHGHLASHSRNGVLSTWVPKQVSYFLYWRICVGHNVSTQAIRVASEESLSLTVPRKESHMFSYENVPWRGVSIIDMYLGNGSFTSCLPTLLSWSLHSAFCHPYLVLQNRSGGMVLPKPSGECRASGYERWILYFKPFSEWEASCPGATDYLSRNASYLTIFHLSSGSDMLWCPIPGSSFHFRSHAELWPAMMSGWPPACITKHLDP